MTSRDKKRNAEADLYGVEDPRVSAIRHPSSRYAERTAAAAKAIREQGLWEGVVTQHGGNPYVITEIDLRGNTISSQHLNDLRLLEGGTPIVRKNNDGSGYSTPFPQTILYKPRPGFGHIQCVFLRRSSLAAKKNTGLKGRVLERLSADEQYENEYGIFVSLSAARRVLDELEQEI